MEPVDLVQGAVAVNRGDHPYGAARLSAYGPSEHEPRLGARIGQDLPLFVGRLALRPLSWLGQGLPGQ